MNPDRRHELYHEHKRAVLAEIKFPIATPLDRAVA